MVLDEIVVKPEPVENNCVKNDGFFTSIGKGFSEYGNMWKDMIPAVNWVNLVLTDPNGAGPNAKDLPDPRPNARVVEHELRSLQQQLFDPLGLVVNQKQKIVLGPVSQVDLLKNATDVHLGINTVPVDTLYEDSYFNKSNGVTWRNKIPSKIIMSDGDTVDYEY